MPVALVVVVLLVVAVLVGAAVLLVALFNAAARQRSARTNEMARFAAAREFVFLPDDPVLLQHFSRPPFGRRTASAQNVLRGRHRGRDVVAFDYRFFHGSGDNRHLVVVPTVAIALPHPLPGLEIVRSTGGGRFLDALRGGDHRIGEPVFDDAFRIFTDHPAFAAAVLDHDMRGWLLSVPDAPALMIDGANLLVIEKGYADLAGVERRLAYGSDFLDRVPPAVWAAGA